MSEASPYLPDRDAMLRHVELVFGGGFDGALDGLIELAWTDPVTGSLRNAQLFGTDQLEELIERAVELNRVERCNVYVGAALRKPETPPAKRTADTDFHSAPFAWADIDLDRVDAAVRMTKAAGMPATMTVVTGRHPHTRAQFWWRLIDAERDGAAIKALCAQLALALGGDSTVSNPGRVLRLGGSIAWPLKPGRVVEATEVHIPEDDRPPAYWASALAQAFAAPAPLLQAAPASSEPFAPPDAPAPSKPKPLDLPIGSLSVEATLAAIQRNDHWHHNAVRLVGNWVARGLSNAEILAFAPALTIGSAPDGRTYTVDQTRLDLNAMITGARRKWNLPNPAVTIEDKLPPPPSEGRRIVKTYDYTDAGGELLYQVVRYEPKTFTQRRPAEPGCWIWGLGAGEYMRRGPGKDWYRFDAKRWKKLGPARQRMTLETEIQHGLYRIVELRERGTDDITWLPEGEKDVDALIDLGLFATTNSGGAANWTDDVAKAFADADVVILVDNDEPGRKRGEKVAASLRGVARRVRVLDLSKFWKDIPQKGDVFDWIKSGGTAKQLEEFAGKVEPIGHAEATVNLSELTTC